MKTLQKNIEIIEQKLDVLNAKIEKLVSRRDALLKKVENERSKLNNMLIGNFMSALNLDSTSGSVVTSDEMAFLADCLKEHRKKNVKNTDPDTKEDVDSKSEQIDSPDTTKDISPDSDLEDDAKDEDEIVYKPKNMGW